MNGAGSPGRNNHLFGERYIDYRPDLGVKRDRRHGNAVRGRLAVRCILGSPSNPDNHPSTEATRGASQSKKLEEDGC